MRESLRTALRGPARLLVLACWGLTAVPASGQLAPPAPTMPPALPPSERFDSTAPPSLPMRLAPAAGTNAPNTTRPPAEAGTDAAAVPSARSTPAPPPRLPIDTTLIPGRAVEPIDLTNALKLAGERAIDIGVARQRVIQAMADLSQARALWLPSIFYGPTWYRADGKIQTVNGPVETLDRNSLYVGGTAALANAFPAPSPGTGFPSLNGLSSTLRISDAIFEPMAARRLAAARRAGFQAATNDTLLQVAEAYFELQAANGRLAIAREAAANAEGLSKITGSYAELGQGSEADHRRSLAELKRRRREIQLASGQLLVNSANLVRLLILDPAKVLAPIEPAEAIIRLIPDEVPLDELVILGMQNRPELANAQELVEAARLRWKQARLRPFIPSVALTFAGGGFGGGQNAFFGNFGPRSDVAASVFWDLRNLGFTDVAIMRRRASEHETAHLEQVRTQAQVAADVVAAYETRQAAARQIEDARDTVVEAIDSLRLNFLNIRQGAGLPRATRPIEVLQPIQALAQARLDYLESVIAYNRAQVQLKRAIGQPP